MLPFVYIGNFSIPMYNAMSVTGAVMAFFAFIIIAKAFNLKDSIKILVLFTTAIIIGFVFSIFLANLTYFDNLEKFKQTFFKMKGNTFIGGIFLALILFYITSKKYIITNNPIIYIIPSLLLIQIFGRLGCVFAGCCYGIPSFSKFAVKYPEFSFAAMKYGEGVKVLPLPLFEVIFLILLLAIIIYMLNKKKQNIFPLYLISFGIYAFINSLFIGETQITVLSFHLSGWVSLLFIIWGIMLLSKRAK